MWKYFLKHFIKIEPGKFFIESLGKTYNPKIIMDGTTWILRNKWTPFKSTGTTLKLFWYSSFTDI